MNDDEFLHKVNEILIDINELAIKYEVEDRLLSASVYGLIERDILGNTSIKAVYNYTLEDLEELNDILTFIIKTYKDKGDDDDGPDLSGLLDGTGIFLN